MVNTRIVQQSKEILFELNKQVKKSRMRISYIVSVLIIIGCTSCKSYVDVQNNSFENDQMSFQFNCEQNNFKYYSNIKGRADDELFSSEHFEIDLPKNLNNWMGINNQFYFEYDHNQIILVYVPYKEEKKEEVAWELVDLAEEKIVDYMYDYWSQMNYNDNKLNELHLNRVNKVYTNGRYEIVLYNIKEKNFQHYLDQVKYFKIN